MKKNLSNLLFIIPLLTILISVFTGCNNAFTQSSFGNFGNTGTPDENGITITDDGSTTNYTDTSSATARAVISEDLYENFTADGIVYVNFNGTSVTANLAGQSEITASATESILGTIANKKITIITTSNTEAGTDADGNEIDEASNGIILQYKGTGKIKYVLTGTYTGTVFIKNKSADAALVMNNVNITSDNGAGPVLRFSSPQRTFIVAPANTENTLTDTRVLNQINTMYDDKKGSVYSKGALIFTGESSGTEGGSISIINKGYKHAVYSKDYVRIANLSLNVSVSGVKGRDCIRALNAVIIDNGNINLTGKGTIQDDESVGIKVEGEDADEDELTVEYTTGAGFVIINGGKLTINTVAKGITAHWKSSESVISNANYTATANQSLLYSTFLNGTSATTPNPYVEINGGIINITTTGEPYEGATDDDPSCSPEGIESKGNLTINAGTITLNCTDDAINAAGNITINGGAIYAYSSKNDAIDSNGSNGIIINGGVIVALGLKTPECAFDCDQNPFKINGGLLVGLGTSNFSSPTNCTQGSFVLSSSHYGSANTSFAIVDSNDQPVFVYTLPAYTGEVMVLASPLLAANTSYSVKIGISVSGGTRFHNLYTSLPSISGGSTSLSSISLSTSSNLYTDSGISSGFGGRP